MAVINPAELVIRRFGGVRAAARIIGRDPSAICRWRQRKRVPSSAQRQVMKAARFMRIPLTAEELIYGGHR